jgi:hypothetical protein
MFKALDFAPPLAFLTTPCAFKALIELERARLASWERFAAERPVFERTLSATRATIASLGL